MGVMLGLLSFIDQPNQANAIRNVIVYNGGQQPTSHPRNKQPFTTTTDKPSTAVHSNKFIPTTNQNQPIIFMHGYNGSYWSEQYLIHSLAHRKHVRKSVIIYIDAKHHIHTKGHYKYGKYTHNTIGVVMRNKWDGEYVFTKQLRIVMDYLVKHYHFSQYEAVGHSMGAYSWVDFMERYPYFNQKVRPTKLLTMSGSFDGIIRMYGPKTYRAGQSWKFFNDGVHVNHISANGRPSIMHPEYRRLLNRRHKLPRGLRILNLYGDLGDGSHSDGVVTTVSAQSLKYVVRGLGISYHQKRFYGYLASHEQIHIGNEAVKKMMARYLI